MEANGLIRFIPVRLAVAWETLHSLPEIAHLRQEM